MVAQPTYHVAQMNWGILRADWDDPAVAGFVDNLDRVNGVAERSEGFVWRMTDADMEAAQNDPAGVFGANSRLASTMSVWATPEALERFVRETIHGDFVKRRLEWFEHRDEPTYVIWPVPAGHIPTLTEAKERLDLLKMNGASPDAYDFSYLRARRASTEAA
jgi:hypothetical protein